jgi:hypothetical protein
VQVSDFNPNLQAEVMKVKLVRAALAPGNYFLSDNNAFKQSTPADIYFQLILKSVL